MFQSVLSGSVTITDIRETEVLSKLKEKLDTMKSNLQNYKTAKLWLQYMDMIDLLRDFIRDRTENWTLHLQTMYDMLPYFAESGHNQYLKSIHLYLQKMTQLSDKHPDVYAHFMAGLHVWRRSDNLWAGLSVHLVIGAMPDEKRQNNWRSN